MRVPSRAVIRMSQVGLAVVVLDLASKAVAATALGDQAISLLPWLRLHLVHNLGGAFGLSAGAYTWQLNLALTTCAILFVFPVAKDLSKVDRSAPRALGLILGGALGNLASLVAPPAGVADFLEVQWQAGHALVLNFADIAAYLGLALITRTGFRIVGAIRQEVRVASAERIARVYARESARAAALASQREMARRSRRAPAAESLVHDWSQVVDLGVVRADAPVTTEPVFLRPLGAVTPSAVRLVTSDRDGSQGVVTAPVQERPRGT